MPEPVCHLLPQNRSLPLLRPLPCPHPATLDVVSAGISGAARMSKETKISMSSCRMTVGLLQARWQGRWQFLCWRNFLPCKHTSQSSIIRSKHRPLIGQTRDSEASSTSFSGQPSVHMWAQPQDSHMYTPPGSSTNPPLWLHPRCSDPNPGDGHFNRPLAPLHLVILLKSSLLADSVGLRARCTGLCRSATRLCIGGKCSKSARKTKR